MTIITSKRHPVKFYTVLIFVFLFLSALGTLFLFVSFDLLQKDNTETKNYFLPIFSIAFYFLAFSMTFIDVVLARTKVFLSFNKI